MLTKFKDEQRMPFDRPCFVLNSKNEKFHVLTMGAASFVKGTSLEFRSNFSSNLVPHILVGRFSNLSWDLKFVLGFNHTYKNSVATYAFYDRGFMNKIISQMENKENLSDFKLCKNRLSSIDTPHG